MPDVENVSDVDSETEESADAFAADAETAASNVTTSSSIQISNTRSRVKGPMDLSQKDALSVNTQPRCLETSKEASSLDGDARNSDLGLLAINTRRAKALEVQRIIDAFAVNHNNRRIVLV